MAPSTAAIHEKESQSPPSFEMDRIPMKRLAHALATSLSWALFTLACATTPSETVVTNPMPSVDQLSNWLTNGSPSASEPSRYFIQMADTQLGMSEY
jgi:hypothetical protein